MYSKGKWKICKAIVDIKSVITGHLKTSHKLYKTIRKSQKVSSL